MNNLILAEGDIGIDAEGWVHGPLRRRADGLGLYANPAGRGFTMSWDFHGQRLADHPTYPDLVDKGRMAPKDEAVAVPATNAMVMIQFSPEVAEDNMLGLHGLFYWIEGLVAGSKIHRYEIPEGIHAVRDVVHLLKHAIKERT